MTETIAHWFALLATGMGLALGLGTVLIMTAFLYDLYEDFRERRLALENRRIELEMRSLRDDITH